MFINFISRSYKFGAPTILTWYVSTLSLSLLILSENRICPSYFPSLTLYCPSHTLRVRTINLEQLGETRSERIKRVIISDNVIRKLALSQLFPKGKARVDWKAYRRKPRRGGKKDLVHTRVYRAYLAGVPFGVRCIDHESDDREGKIDR